MTGVYFQNYIFQCLSLLARLISVFSGNIWLLVAMLDRTREFPGQWLHK